MTASAPVAAGVAPPVAPPAARRGFAGQPAGFGVLFYAGLWEVFSLYGMRTLLIYYTTKQLGYSAASASEIYGAYVGSLYLTPLVGGLVADQALGRKRAVLAGGSLMALGHFLLVFPAMLIPALVILTLGNGLFKPAITTQVGDLYARAPELRDRGYGLFYVAVNLGSFIAPLVCGILGERFGWGLGFAAAGLGMLTGLAVYAGGLSRLPDDIQPRRRAPLAPGGVSALRENASLVAVTAIASLFWAAYAQHGSTVAYWVDADVDRRVWLGSRAWTLPAAWFQSVNPLLIFLLAPILNWAWSRQARRGAEPGALAKMSIGAALLAASYVTLAAAAWLQPAGASMLWLLAYCVPLTIGELFMSPIGQSYFSKNASAGLSSMMMGIWFLTHTFGYYGAGLLGTQWETSDKAAFFLMVAFPPLLCAALLTTLRRSLPE